MKVVIFAGGYGTRLSEETTLRPKPMVEVGGRPILWHIMKMYAGYGHREFVILGGYKVEFIRRYFLEFMSMQSDFTVDLKTGSVKWLSQAAEDWSVTVLDTGLETMTGGRLKRARHVIGNERFFLTYGDGVSDVDLDALVAYHDQAGAAVTLTAVNPPGRFGVIGVQPGSPYVQAFREKDRTDTGVINGGFFVCEPSVFDLIDDDTTVWEAEPMDRLVNSGRLAAYRHNGYWQSMDTVRDRVVLEKVYADGAPWLRRG